MPRLATQLSSLGHLEHGMHVMTKPFQLDVFAQRVKSLIKPQG